MISERDGKHCYVHYAPPSHAKAHLSPTEWNDEWQLGAYICTGATTFVAEFDHQPPAEVECKSLSRDALGVITLTAMSLADNTEVHIPIN